MAGKKRASDAGTTAASASSRRRTTTAEVDDSATAPQNQVPDVVQSTSDDASRDVGSTEQVDEVTIRTLSKHIWNLRGSEQDVNASLEWLLKVGFFDPRVSVPEQDLPYETASQAVKLGILPNLLSCIPAWKDTDMIVEQALAVLGALLLSSKNDFPAVMSIAVELDIIGSIVGSMKIRPRRQMITRLSLFSLKVIFRCFLDESPQDRREVDISTMTELLEIDDSIYTIIKSTDSEELVMHRTANLNLMDLILNLKECDDKLDRKYRVRDLLVAEGAISQVAKIIETMPEYEDVQKSARKAMSKLIQTD